MRGAIETITTRRLIGWIHSDTIPTQGSKVVALLGEKCVGTGRVSKFRQDLLDAGLEGGHCGFDFKIKLPPSGDEGAVVVKLDGSDWVILPQSAHIEPPEQAGSSLFLEPKALDWVRSRGWYGQMEYDLATSLYRRGVYDRSLRVGANDDRNRSFPILNPKQETQQLFDVLHMQRVTLHEHKPVSLSALVKDWPSIAHFYLHPVISLWSATRIEIIVAERSHRSSKVVEGRAEEVRHYMAPDRLLFLDLRCRLQTLTTDATPGLRAFSVAGLVNPEQIEQSKTD